MSVRTRADAIEQFRAATRRQAAAERDVLGALSSARRAGATWQDLADVLGVTRQAVAQRYGRLADAPDPEPRPASSATFLLRDEVREVIRAYLARMPGAYEADMNDAVYRAFLRWAETLLWMVNIGMDDEDIDYYQRVRILRSALYGGAPSYAEAHDRIAAHAARVEHLMRTTTPYEKGTPS